MSAIFFNNALFVLCGTVIGFILGICVGYGLGILKVENYLSSLKNKLNKNQNINENVKKTKDDTLSEPLRTQDNKKVILQ